jgi:arylsulfatase A-like enzyme
MRRCDALHAARALCALLAFALAPASAGAADPAPAEGERVLARPSVVLIVVDSLRKDHLGVYGYERPTSPNIDAFAAKATRYTRAYAAAPWTTPSMGALLTSRHPSTLGIGSAEAALPAESVLLSELLSREGYQTAGIVSHSFCSERWGFAQGFDHFDDSNALGQLSTTSPGVTNRALEALERFGNRPFFLLVHYFDPHYSYVRHVEFPFPAPAPGYTGPIKSGLLYRALVRLKPRLTGADVDELRRLYDSEIAYADREIGRLLDKLRGRGLLERGVVVLTSDHGEEFLDHGDLGHGKTLYEELIAVPLIVKVPGAPASVVDRPVGLVDVYPTISRMIGAKLPGKVAGRSLLAAPDAEERPVFSETERGARAKAVVRGRYKLIEKDGAAGHELYDVVSDPRETRNLAETESATRTALAGLLDGWKAKLAEEKPARAAVQLSEQERARLEKLGYLDE